MKIFFSSLQYSMGFKKPEILNPFIEGTNRLTEEAQKRPITISNWDKRGFEVISDPTSKRNKFGK